MLMLILNKHHSQVFGGVSRRTTLAVSRALRLLQNGANEKSVFEYKEPLYKAIAFVYRMKEGK